MVNTLTVIMKPDIRYQKIISLNGTEKNLQLNPTRTIAVTATTLISNI